MALINPPGNELNAGSQELIVKSTMSRLEKDCLRTAAR